ncbi:protein moonraker isoform X4 [Willisornis vidua]|uniref:Protein moonraker isoform X4 n=1 Tax=Willisornis vidua TaxID=1566151 RepID=A0ABQ9DAR1_9PASS|nr:protein moonraker isoform X4 [Willisornis vidua]
MGPSKAPVLGDAFAFSAQRYGSEAKPLQTQLQFNRNVPAVPENLAVRFSHPRPIVIEKLKASSDQRNPAGSEDLSLRSSGMFSVVSEERLKLAVQLAKRDIKRRRLEEQVKQQVLGNVVSKPLWAQNSQQQKTEVFASPRHKRALKSQTQQRLHQPSQGESARTHRNVYLYVAEEGRPRSAVLDSPPTRDTGPDPKPNLNKKEHKNTQEVRRLQKELRSYVQKIEEMIKKGKDTELLDPEDQQRLCIRRQEQAARSARMLYVLQQQVKEIQDDLEKLSPHTIKHTKKSRAVARLAAAQRGAVRTLQAFASQFTDQTEEHIPAHYKELGSLIRQLSLCSAKLEGDSSISDIIIDILLQVEGMLKSLKPGQVRPRGRHAGFRKPTISFQLKETKRPAKESRVPCTSPKPPAPPVPPKRPARLETENSRGVKVLPDLHRGEIKKIEKIRSPTVSPAQCADKAENKVQEELEPLSDRTHVEQQVAANADILSEKLLDDLLEDTAQELWSMEQEERLQTEALPMADTHSLESMLQRMEEIERHRESVRRRIAQIVYTDSHFWAQEDKMEQQMASAAKRPTSPHPIQITKLMGHTELETNILVEKPFDDNDIGENKEAEEKLQTGNDILQPLPLNSLQKACSVSLSVPSHMLQSILDYNSRYKRHLKLISHEVVGSFDPWQIAESLAEQLTEEALCDVAAELQDVCEDYAEAVFTSEFLQPVQ